MKRLALLLIFIFGFLLIQAQQKIVFANKNNNSSKSYSLPLSVTCTFIDGSEKRLILENVIDDSLVFKKYYNQDNYNCKFASITKLHIHKNGEGFLYGFFGAFSAYTIYAGYYGFNVKTDPSSELIIIPATIISGAISLIFLSTLPKNYKPKTYKIHAL